MENTIILKFKFPSSWTLLLSSLHWSSWYVQLYWLKSLKMMDWAAISNNLAVLKDTTLPMESIVSSVQHLNIGIQSCKDVSLVMPDTLGTALLINAHAVKHPDKSSVAVVYVLPPKHNGMKQRRHAHVQSTLSETTVSHAHYQGNGTLKLTLVPVLPQLQYGMVQLVPVQLEDMDHHVWNVQLQDIGMLKPINVPAPCLLFGMETTVFALNPISFTKEDAQAVQLDIHGKIINAKAAHATTRIWKF